ncbi:MAG: hypothetical protein GX115_13570 [Ruminiclostridium sp.]|nr:hypothetical protein [Ruminiclostridium sp.]
MLRLSNIKIRINEAANIDAEQTVLRKKILSRLRIHEEELKGFTIVKKSVDARKKEDIVYVYTVDIETSQEKKLLAIGEHKDLVQAPELIFQPLRKGSERLTERPVIIGMGPAGLFAGLMLARNGYRPILFERGGDVDARTDSIHRFWKEGRLNSESNVQFGEGGAGTFSDGKLTTLINDTRCSLVLKEFTAAGAPQEILYSSKPHIGTDLLKGVVKNLRQDIIAHGGDVRFNARVTDFIIEGGQLKALIINNRETIKCNIILLAIGHSARDTFEVLYRKGVVMSPKPFSIGVRIEQPQRLINQAQYGSSSEHPGLGAADYKLAYHSKSGRSAYTFCMCPGGYVVAAASEEHCVVTNGMSEFKRDGENANAALLVGVTPADFPGDHPLAGIEFQRKWEGIAFEAGGRAYKAPVQLVGDFLADRVSTTWGSVKPTYLPGVAFAPLNKCLPGYVIDTMKEAILYFNTKLKGFSMPESILTGVETRSSSPVRINRDENFLSNVAGLYPVGEGAGYAGGIISAALDGIKTAEKVMERYAPL